MSKIHVYDKQQLQQQNKFPWSVVCYMDPMSQKERFVLSANRILLFDRGITYLWKEYSVSEGENRIFS